MKNTILIITITLCISNSFAQNLDSTALLLIDIQKFYFPGGAVELVEPEKAAENAQKVLTFFRKNNGTVVHVAHKVKAGGEIHEMVSPLEGEKVIVKKEVSCFKGTDLHWLLQNKGINKVVLVGMQTHMCLEGGTRAASDLGYKCIVIHDACATRDLKFGETKVKACDVHASTLNTLQSYAKILSSEEYLNR